jgi:phosphatidylglycerol lysyltransferase
VIVNRTISGREAALDLEPILPLQGAVGEKTEPEKTNPAQWLRPFMDITALAWAVRLVSLFDMLNALLRYQPKLIFWLGKWVPFELSEGHRVRMFLMSVLLFLLASGLQRGKRVAWQITIAGLLVAPILHIGREVIWPQALVNIILIGFLILRRDHFVAKSDPKSIRSALFICPALAMALLIFGTVRLHALHKHTNGDHSWLGCVQTAGELILVHRSPTQISLTRQADELFALLRMGGTLIALGGMLLILRPVLARRMARAELKEKYREKARRIIALYGDDSLNPYALLHDKSYFFTANGRLVVPYVLSGNLAVVLADPIGPVEERPTAIIEFALFCRHQDWEPVFYEVTEELSFYYEQAGFVVFKIGEEARLDANDFHLKGRDFQNLRTARNMAHKQSLTFRWYSAADGIDEALERELGRISQAWLEEKHAKEMTFDMGAFSLEDIRRDGAAIAIDPAGHALAFATWRPFAAGKGRCLDLMRSLPNHRNVMDFVLVEAILRFHEKGINDVSLGCAPLANADVEPTPMQAEDKAVLFLYQNLNSVYGYKSLFEFKRKYRPRWRGRYIAYHRGIHLPMVGLALVRVHSPGGLLSFFRK